MSFPLTRAAAAATLAYNIAAIARPHALVTGLNGQVTDEQARLLTRTWFGRDVPISGLALLGRPDAVPVAAGLRIAADLTDAAVLGIACTGSARTKALGVTLGWAAVNAVAVTIDRRRR